MMECLTCFLLHIQELQQRLAQRGEIRLAASQDQLSQPGEECSFPPLPQRERTIIGGDSQQEAHYFYILHSFTYLFLQLNKYVQDSNLWPLIPAGDALYGRLAFAAGWAEPHLEGRAAALFQPGQSGQRAGQVSAYSQNLPFRPPHTLKGHFSSTGEKLPLAFSFQIMGNLSSSYKERLASENAYILYSSVQKSKNKPL